MRLLWLTKQFPYPPAQGGDIIYSRHLIEGCAAIGAQVCVVCYGKSAVAPVTGVQWRVLHAAPKNILASLFSSLPNLVTRYDTNAFRSAIVTAAREAKWDAVILDGIAALGQLELVLTEFSVRSFKIVYLSHNHEETTRLDVARKSRNPVLKILLHLDAHRTALLERRNSSLCDIIGVNTEEDGGYFRRQTPTVPILLLQPGYDGPRRGPRSLSAVPRSVIILGSFLWVAKRLNLEAFLEAAENILPNSGIALKVVGFMREDYRAKLARRYPWATIVGPVTDVSQELSQARIGIVAEQAGGGFKHKILNYVFERLPVAALEVAMAGVRLEPTKEYIAATNMAELVKKVTAMIDEADQLQAMADAAYDRCKSGFNWNERCSKLVAAISGLGTNGIDR